MTKRMETHRTIRSATYTPSAERADGEDWCRGDVTYVTFEECDHVVLGNATMTYKPGTQMRCRQCTNDAAEREKRVAENAAKLAAAPVLTAGRREIVGTILSTKWVENDFGGALKMLVQEENGNRLWGTMPAKLRAPDGSDPAVGDVVGFTATVQPSNDDGHFGFYKRPTGASFIERPAA